MVTRIGLESYEVMACHGAYDFEREKKQPFVISIWATLVSDVDEDNLEMTLNYADLQTAVYDEVVNSEPVKLMETLCKKLVERISQNSLVESISYFTLLYIYWWKWWICNVGGSSDGSCSDGSCCCVGVVLVWC